MTTEDYEIDLPRLSEFEPESKITVNGGVHRVTGTGTEGGMNVVALGDRGDHPFMELRWYPGSGRALLRRLHNGATDREFPVEQFALGEVDIREDRNVDERPRVGL